MTEPSKEAEKANRDMARAAREISEAAREMSRAVDALRTNWKDYERVLRMLLEAGVELEKPEQARLSDRVLIAGLPEEVAAVVADEAVHRVRGEMARERADEPKAPPPTQEEVEDWERRRDERRREAS